LIQNMRHAGPMRMSSFSVWRPEPGGRKDPYSTRRNVPIVVYALYIVLYNAWLIKMTTLSRIWLFVKDVAYVPGNAPETLL
jgi:hypothetical protein